MEIILDLFGMLSCLGMKALLAGHGLPACYCPSLMASDCDSAFLYSLQKMCKGFHALHPTTNQVEHTN
jgi:hypothetical protein